MIADTKSYQRWLLRLWAGLLVTALVPLTFTSCSRHAQEIQRAASQNARVPTANPEPRLQSDSHMVAVRFLEERVAKDPDDVVALNKLSNYYLQIYRESYDNAYLDLAMRSAQSSLRVLGADQNLSGLLALSQAEFATHDFVSARTHATELTEYQPGKSYGYQVLGDALLELGDYEQAGAAYSQMETFDPGSVATEARLAHVLTLRGETVLAKKRYENALAA